MINIILTAVIGVSLLGGLSFFLVWYGEYSKKKEKHEVKNRFHSFDKYFSEMETASEKQMELKRQERMSVFKQGRTDVETSALSGLTEEAAS